LHQNSVIRAILYTRCLRPAEQGWSLPELGWFMFLVLGRLKGSLNSSGFAAAYIRLPGRPARNGLRQHRIRRSHPEFSGFCTILTNGSQPPASWELDGSLRKLEYYRLPQVVLVHGRCVRARQKIVARCRLFSWAENCCYGSSSESARFATSPFKARPRMFLKGSVIEVCVLPVQLQSWGAHGV